MENLQHPHEKHPQKTFTLGRISTKLYYLSYEVNVARNSILELGTTPRKNKIVSRLPNPILLFLVLDKFRVRNIVIPNLKIYIQIQI